MITYRQCNNCSTFKDISLVPKVQIFGKLYPIGSVKCLCRECLAAPLDVGQRYIILSDSKDY